jgi:hypothetical protein
MEVEVKVEWEGKRVVERDSSGRCCVQVGHREMMRDCRCWCGLKVGRVVERRKEMRDICGGDDVCVLEEEVIGYPVEGRTYQREGDDRR